MEKLQNDEDDEDGVKYVKRRQELWDAQYIQHRHNLTRTKEPFLAVYILMEILGLRPDTPSEDERSTQQEIKDLEADARKKDAIPENWSMPPGSP